MKHAPPPPALAHLVEDLAKLGRADLLRERSRDTAPSGPSFCSNDYLGLAVRQTDGALHGAGASRLVSGDQPEHAELEQALSQWLETSSALLFTSGYAANVGLVSALAGPDDLIVSDALNHASLVDGCRLSKATTKVFPHLDVRAAEKLLEVGSFRRRWVLTESYFSMDADSPDLGAFRRICDDHDAALVVDEAHALGVLGPDGRGLAAEAGVVPDVLVGTFGKAFGTGGAFVAGCDALTAWLWNRARSFVFSTGLSPSLAAAGSRSLRQLRGHPELRKRTAARAEQLRSGLVKLGLQPLGHGHVVPVVLGESGKALSFARRLQALGFGVRPIRPPSVPPGTARVRLTVSALHTEEDVRSLLDGVRSALQ